MYQETRAGMQRLAVLYGFVLSRWRASLASFLSGALCKESAARCLWLVV